MTSVDPDAPSLHHIIVVGGTSAEWAATSGEHWTQLVDELGKVADHVGAGWLTLRPYGGSDAATQLEDRSATVGSCVVSVEPESDGRRRVASAVERLRENGQPITEAGIAREMNSPAAVDPDLVVVVGPGHRLPPSLVWELAYSELVFIDASWQQLAAAHLDDAINSYALRNRRFGGVD